MDMLFASPSPWAWEAEKNFKILKEQNSGMVSLTNPDAERRRSLVTSLEHGEKVTHVDQVTHEDK
jgi:hypothetical protein